MKYKRYDKYKETGIKCLNEIPKVWELKKYKYVLKIFQGNAFKSSDYVDCSNVVSLRMGNIKKGGHIDLNHKLKYLPEIYQILHKNYILRENDIVIAMTDMSPSLDFLAVPATVKGLEKDKIYLLNQRVGKLIFDKTIKSEYVKYSLLSIKLREYLKANGLGTVQANMSNEDLYDAHIATPPINEQKEITKYLDEKTSKIDLLLQKLGRQKELLVEKRSALINKAVTRGLNPDALMKKTGNNLIPAIPESWKVKRLKYEVSINRQALSEQTTSNYEIEYIDIGSVSLINGITETVKLTFGSSPSRARRIVKSGDSIISTVRTYLKAITFVEKANHNLIASTGFAVITPHRKHFNKHFGYLFMSQLFIDSVVARSTGVSYPAINASDIGNIFIPIPFATEQKQIADYLEKQTAKIDLLQSKTDRQIELLKEYRASLITSAVTGQIKITSSSN